MIWSHTKPSNKLNSFTSLNTIKQLCLKEQNVTSKSHELWQLVFTLDRRLVRTPELTGNRKVPFLLGIKPWLSRSLSIIWLTELFKTFILINYLFWTFYWQSKMKIKLDPCGHGMEHYQLTDGEYLVGAQSARWDNCSTEPAQDCIYMVMGKRTINYRWDFCTWGNYGSRLC